MTWSRYEILRAGTLMREEQATPLANGTKRTLPIPASAGGSLADSLARSELIQELRERRRVGIVRVVRRQNALEE